MWAIDIKNQKNGLYVFAYYNDILILTGNIKNNGTVSFVRRDKYRKYSKYKIVFSGENLLSRINDQKTSHKWSVRQRVPQKKNDNTNEIALVCDNYESYWICFKGAAYWVEYMGVTMINDFEDGSQVVERGCKKLNWRIARKEGDEYRRRPKFSDEYRIIERGIK